MSQVNKLSQLNVRVDDLLIVLDDRELIKANWTAHTEIVDWLARHFFPYQSDDFLQELRRRSRGSIDPNQWPTDYFQRPPMTFFLGALCGLHEETRAVVESWPSDLYGRQDWDDCYHMPQQMVFGLGDPQLVDHHMRRLKLRLKNPEHVRAWLAHTELTALDYVRDAIQGMANKDQSRQLMEVFCLVNAPESGSAHAGTETEFESARW